MIKLETHSHTLGGSPCAKASDEDFVKDFVNAGYGGVVITNHISECFYKYHKGETHAEKVRFYYSLVENMRERLAPYGIKVFCGSEIRVLPENGRPQGEEYTVYGIPERLMYDSKPFFTFTQEELFRFAEKHGLFMYQTHPFRFGVQVGDPRFMHGAEAFNGHFHHYNFNALAKDFCIKNGLIQMSGSDYHHAGQSLVSGIYIPENINTDGQLTEYIFKNEFKIIEEETAYERVLKNYKEQE
ncbi:MAG: PHP domain-containing protein [Clostridia bacterium]|nr:PHP domain-containing protein [Clostridia bacterium]